MDLIRHFMSVVAEADIPQRMTSPFNKTPDPLAWRACELLQAWLTQSGDTIGHDFDAADGGKMFGVLVVKDAHGQLGYLSAFSGMLAGRWQQAGFVPPIFDQAQRDAFLLAGEQRLLQYQLEIESLQNSAERHAWQAKLEHLREQQDIELSALKQRHQTQKLQRRALRTQSEVSQELLQTLSHESQRDKREYKDLLATWRTTLDEVQQALNNMERDIATLKKARQQLSNKLHRQVFAGYTLINRLGEQRPMSALFVDKQPPGGTGDCAGAKLIHYAVHHQLTPIAMAEFWWGAAPKDAIRHHGVYYPACRGKCHPILPFMLKGYDVLPRQGLGNEGIDAAEPQIVYEDEFLLLVNKPSGLLSVPGKEIEDSVYTRIKQRYPEAEGPLLVHRLDMATSGLILIAKNLKTHKALQRQFIKRTIQKRYVAVLSQCIAENEGVIELPLRVDLDDRPRHMVCYQYGKAAKTRWQVVERSEHTTRVYFYPESGRTHQLRIHAAHPQGLNAPIVGDELYGKKDERLLLHAEYLCFKHPETGEMIEVEAPAPF